MHKMHTKGKEGMISSFTRGVPGRWFRFRVSDFKCRVPGVRFQVQGSRCKNLGIVFQV
jgi:hypothetical protein